MLFSIFFFVGFSLCDLTCDSLSVSPDGNLIITEGSSKLTTYKEPNWERVRVVGSVPAYSSSGEDESISWIRNQDRLTELEIYFSTVQFTGISAVQVTATGPDASKGCVGRVVDGLLDRVLVACESLRTGFHVAVDGVVGGTGRAGPLASPDQRPCVAGWKVPNPPYSADVFSVDAASGVVTYAVKVPAFAQAWNAPVTASFTWADDDTPAGNGVTSTAAETTATVTRRGNFFPGLKVVYLDPVNGCPSEVKTVLSGAGSCAGWSESAFAAGITVAATPGIDLASYTASYTASIPAHAGRSNAPVTVTLRWADTLALAGEMVVPRTGGPFTMPLSKRFGPGYLVFPGLRVTVTSIGCPANDASVQVTAVAASAYDPPKGTTIFLDGAVPSYPDVAPMDNGAMTAWKDRSGQGNDLAVAGGDVRFRVAPGTWHGFVQARSSGFLGRDNLAAGTHTGGEYTLAMVVRITDATLDLKRLLSFGDDSGPDSERGVTFEQAPSGGFTTVSRYIDANSPKFFFTSKSGTGLVGLQPKMLQPGSFAFISLTVRTKVAYLTINTQDWYMTHDIFSMGAYAPTKLCVANSALPSAGSACSASSSGVVANIDVAAVLLWPRALSRSEVEELKVWAKARYLLQELHPRCSLIEAAAKRAQCWALMKRWTLVPAPPTPRLLLDADNIDGSGSPLGSGTNLGTLVNTAPSKTSGSDGTCFTNGGTIRYQTGAFASSGSAKGHLEFRNGGYCASINTADVFASTTGAFTFVSLYRSFQRFSGTGTFGLFCMTKTTLDYQDNPNGFAIRIEPPSAQRTLMIDRQGCTRADIANSLWHDRHQTVGNDFRFTVINFTPARTGAIFFDGLTRSSTQTHSNCPSSAAPQKWSLATRMENTGGAVTTTSYSHMDVASVQVFDRSLTWSEIQIIRATFYQSYKLTTLSPNCTMVERKYRHWCHTVQADLDGVDLPRDGLVGEFSAEDPLGTGRHLASGATISSWVNLAKPASGGGIGDLTLVNSPTFVHNAINGRPALRLDAGGQTGTATIGAGVFPGNAATIMVVHSPRGSAGNTWSGADNGGIVCMGRYASPASPDYTGDNGFAVTNNVVGARDTRFVKSSGSGYENSFVTNTNARSLKPALTMASWDQSSFFYSVGRLSYSGGWSGHTSFDPDRLCLAGRYGTGSSSCYPQGAGQDFSAVYIWNKKLSSAEREAAKLAVAKLHKVDLDVDCNQVSSSQRVLCELEGGFPSELTQRLAFQLIADNYDASGLNLAAGATVTSWKNLRDSWLQANAGSSSGASHGTCTTSGGYPKYNVYDPSVPEFLNFKGHIEFRGASYCLASLGAGKFMFPSVSGDANLGFRHGRTIAILFRVVANGGDTKAIFNFGTTTAGKDAHQDGIALEMKSALALWWVQRMDDGTNGLGLSGTSVTGITVNTNYAVVAGEWTLAIMRITTAGAFTQLNGRKLYDSTPSTLTTPSSVSTWSLGTRMQAGAATGSSYVDFDVAYAYAWDGDLASTDLELFKLWTKRKYGLPKVDVDCGEVPPRFMPICASANAGY